LLLLLCTIDHISSLLGLSAKSGRAKLYRHQLLAHAYQLQWQMLLAPASAWPSGSMPSRQQVYQLTMLNLLRVMSHLNSPSMASGLRTHLHRHHLRDNRLKMPGKQPCVWRTQHNTYRQHRQAQAGVGLDFRLQNAKGGDDGADQHVHMTAGKHYKQSYETSCMLSGKVNI